MCVLDRDHPRSIDQSVAAYVALRPPEYVAKCELLYSRVACPIRPSRGSGFFMTILISAPSTWLRAQNTLFLLFSGDLLEWNIIVGKDFAKA